MQQQQHKGQQDQGHLLAQKSQNMGLTHPVGNAVLSWLTPLTVNS